MKTLIGTALAVGLLAGTSALAQEDHNRGEARPASPAGAPRGPQGPQGGPGGGGGYHPPASQPGAGFTRPAGPGPGVGPGPGGGDRNPGAGRPTGGGPPGGQGWGQNRPGGPGPAAPAGGEGWRGGGERHPQGGEYRPAPDGYHPGPGAYRPNEGGPRPGEGGTRPGEGGFRPGEHGFRPGENGFRPGNNGYRPAFGAPGFRPGGERPRYSPQYFPRQFRAERQYEWRGGHWRGPPGFYYRRWNYGEYLPFGWFATQWFMNDYWAYDLPVPPWGCEWVRSGPDALLVDVRTGFVVEVAYGVFY